MSENIKNGSLNNCIMKDISLSKAAENTDHEMGDEFVSNMDEMSVALNLDCYDEDNITEDPAITKMSENTINGSLNNCTIKDISLSKAAENTAHEMGDEFVSNIDDMSVTLNLDCHEEDNITEDTAITKMSENTKNGSLNNCTIKDISLSKAAENTDHEMGDELVSNMDEMSVVLNLDCHEEDNITEDTAITKISENTKNECLNNCTIKDISLSKAAENTDHEMGDEFVSNIDEMNVVLKLDCHEEDKITEDTAITKMSVNIKNGSLNNCTIKDVSLSKTAENTDNESGVEFVSNMDEMSDAMNSNCPEGDSRTEDTAITEISENTKNKSFNNCTVKDIVISKASTDHTSGDEYIVEVFEVFSEGEIKDICNENNTDLKIVSENSSNETSCVEDMPGSPSTSSEAVNDTSDYVKLKITISTDFSENSENGSMHEYKSKEIIVKKNLTNTGVNEKIMESISKGKSLDSIIFEDINSISMPEDNQIKYSTLFLLKHKDKKEILQWCMDAGLIASSYTCAICGRSMKLLQAKTVDGYRWACSYEPKKGKKHRIFRTVRKGTMFCGSALNIIDILILIHCWLYQVPRKWIYLETGFCIETVISFIDYVHDICVHICAADNSKIGGFGEIVEIIGGKFVNKTCRGVKQNNSFVFAGVEDKYAHKHFLCIEEEGSKDSFLEVIQRFVLPGTTIISSLCKQFKLLEEDFSDSDIFSSYEFHTSETYDSSKKRNSFWNTIYHRIPKHNKKEGFFDKYVADFLWRKRNSDAVDLMRTFILAIKTVFPPATKDA